MKDNFNPLQETAYISGIVSRIVGNNNGLHENYGMLVSFSTASDYLS